MWVFGAPLLPGTNTIELKQSSDVSGFIINGACGLVQESAVSHTPTLLTLFMSHVTLRVCFHLSQPESLLQHPSVGSGGCLLITP